MKIYLSILFLACSSAGVLAQFDPHCYDDRKAIVHLFEWRWNDIAAECERFLGPKGFCGVQVSPANEHRAVMLNTEKRPWWERYQPVSYKLYSRSGDEDAFVDMVRRCNAVKVRIYVDVVINHMAGVDAHRAAGVAGSIFNTDTLDFPGVPYSAADFNRHGAECHSGDGNIQNYGDANQVRNCRLVGLTDLNAGKMYVRQKIADFLNHMIDIGVAGFRVDAAKHMWPGDLQAIYGMLHGLNGKWFQQGAKPFIYQEVIDMGGEPIKSAEYFFARVTEFNYGKYLSEMFKGNNQLKHLRTFGQGWGYLMPDDKALVFIDNHDNQRGHGGGGSVLNFFSPRQYKMAVTFMLSWPYGVPRIMSSYRFDNNWMGPPHDSSYNTVGTTINADGSCGNGWVCEHRWRQITNMVKFRNVAGSEPMRNWWDDGDKQIAFSRGNRAFYAVNGGGGHMSTSLQTGLRPGRYCDVISGEKNDNSCTGKTITVGSDGRAKISISSSDEDPIVAIHVDSMIDGQGTDPDPEPETEPTKPPVPVQGYKRTIIFIKYQSNVGDQIFIRGGVSYARRPACEVSYQSCWVPIKYDHVNYPSTHYAGYNAWAEGDGYLDWQGAEQGQGSYLNIQPNGSPLVWTSNVQGDAGYSSFNTFGQHYWMLDVNMDCSSTDDGWFEVKAVLNGRWETDIAQNKRCNGNAGISAPFRSNNHIARCGHKNVFTWSDNSCHVDTL